MANDNDRSRFRLTGKHRVLAEPHVSIAESEAGPGVDEPLIVVSAAYGPTGESMINPEVTFDGWPAVTVGVRAAGREGVVHLSPIHGDARKVGMEDLPAGTQCELFCPRSGAPLEKVGEVEDGSGASYYAIYLTPRLSQGECVQLSDVWGHYHSRIIDDMELISYWADALDGEDEGDWPD
ncbi:MAG: hypothetical protein RIT45_2888 [Pseudomonadota bacterium]|jgi:hypothetical protein